MRRLAGLRLLRPDRPAPRALPDVHYSARRRVCRRCRVLDRGSARPGRLGEARVCLAARLVGACHHRGCDSAPVHSEPSGGQRSRMRGIARFHAQGVFAERGAGQGADGLRRMRQGDLGVPGTRDAGLGLDRGPCPRCLRHMDQSEAPGPGVALLMPSPPPKSDTLQLTEELIARASVSPTDGGCQELMIERLEAVGFTVERMRFGPGDNFWAKHGRGAPAFFFARHPHAAPSGPLAESRSDPLLPVIKDGLLYGRGAADMKSGLAAMLTACEEFVGRYPAHRGTIAFLITSDEEGPSVDGTRRALEVLRERSEASDWWLVGEPSSESALRDTIKIGRRGSCSGRLTVHGIQWHIASPQFAGNPVHAVAPPLAE